MFTLIKTEKNMKASWGAHYASLARRTVPKNASFPPARKTHSYSLEFSRQAGGKEPVPTQTSVGFLHGINGRAQRK
jgi:hypothetical protein